MGKHLLQPQYNIFSASCLCENFFAWTPLGLAVHVLVLWVLGICSALLFAAEFVSLLQDKLDYMLLLCCCCQWLNIVGRYACLRVAYIYLHHSCCFITEHEQVTG